MAKKKSTRRKVKLPSWREVRAGLLQATKSKLVLCIGRIYLSRATPRSVKLKIITVATSGARSVTRKAKSTGRKTKRRASRVKSKAKTKFITIKKRGGGTRKQKVKVLASGKYRFVKN